MRSIFKEKPRVAYPRVGRFHVRIESYPDDSLSRTLAARLVSVCRTHWQAALLVFALTMAAAIYVGVVP